MSSYANIISTFRLFPGVRILKENRKALIFLLAVDEPLIQKVKVVLMDNMEFENQDNFQKRCSWSQFGRKGKLTFILLEGPHQIRGYRLRP